MRQLIISQRVDGDSLEKHMIDLLSDGSVVRCRALIAFTTLNGLLKLGTDSEGTLWKFLDSPDKSLEWILGVDSVTTSDALREILRLTESAKARCNIRAFSSSEGRLFHPKVYIFDRIRGTPTVLVGSGNMTPGGLSENIEVMLRLDDLTVSETREWNELWKSYSNQGDVREIDGEILRLVESRRSSERRRRQVRLTPEEAVEETEAPSVRPRMLVRYIPQAGGRTSQVHFTRQIVERFFHLPLRGGGVIHLQQVQPGQCPQPIEERGLVYSKVNRNPKVEVNGARMLISNYPSGGKRPIVILEEIGVSSYRYMILLPREKGYTELSRQLDKQPKEGAALPSWLTDLDSLLEVWSDYPH